MPGDDRKISVLACVLLVTLRLMIGWHLFYEGVWKLKTQSTAQPWSAEGYLKTAVGPLRNTFRDLTGDPWDERWLDYDRMVAEWDDWYARFTAHYPGVNDRPAKGPSVAERLAYLLNGPADFRVPLESLPEGVDLSRWKNVITFDPQAKRLIVKASLRLLPSERDEILKLAPVLEMPTAETQAQATAILRFRKAVQDLFTVQSRLSYKERLAALLKGDPDRAGVDQKDKEDRVIEQRLGDIALYRQQVQRYLANEAAAKTKYQWDHVDRQWRELQDLKRRCIGPVQALDAELRKEAEALLSESQLAAGPAPERRTPVRQINDRTMWGLTVVGVLLTVGLFTRLAAVGGAGLLMLFYLAVPPWPGVPEIPGPDHAFIVNKVFLEAVACLAIAALPTGRWFGLDAVWAALFRRRTADAGQ